MTQDKDVEASDLPEVSVAGVIDDGNTNKTPDYVRTIDIDIENIDKHDKNTWMTIYEEIDSQVELLPGEFLGHFKKYPNDPQNIPTETKKNIKTRLRRNFICAGGYDSSEKNGSKYKTGLKKNCLKDSLKDQSIGFILTLSG